MPVHPVHDDHKKRFLRILHINILVFIAELWIALYSGSLVMLSDSIHVSIHILAPFIAYISEFEFLGFRAQVIKKWTAGINIFLFVFLAGGIAYEAWGRLTHPPELKIGAVFFIIAILGLAVNVYSAFLLHTVKDKECEQNIKPLFWHMVFDGAGSVIVVVSAVVMYRTSIYILDPILSFVLAALIVMGAIFMFKGLLHKHEH